MQEEYVTSQPPLDTEQRSSRYCLKELPAGKGLLPALMITGEQRFDNGRHRPVQNPVLVSPSADGTHLRLYYGQPYLDRDDRPGAAELMAAAQMRDETENGYARNRIAKASFGLFDYFGMANKICAALNTGWTGPKDKPQPANQHVRQWVHKRTGQAISQRLHAYYQSTLKKLQHSVPGVVTVQRTVFAATFGAPPILFEPGLYGRPYLVSDLARYRAAGVALANTHFLIPAHTSRTDLQKTLDALDHGGWRGLLSPDGQSYRALNRTLDRLPGGVPHQLVTYLSRMHLKEPIRDRSTLAIATIYHKILDATGPQALHHSPFLAEPGRIKRAVSIVAAHTGQQLSFRRTEDLARVVSFLLDYPGAHEHRGNIVGLAGKSVRWHRDEARNHARRMAERLGGDRRAALPPVELPADEGLEFLSSVQRICEEGRLMENCVGSYARQAVEGESFLFHALKGGEQATAEVDPRGNLVQASGPSNRPNGAARWAARTLRRWGTSFPAAKRSGYSIDHDLDGSISLEEDPFEAIPF